MNQAAERHLDKAATYLAKGEEWYRKAAAEIVAAQAADSTLSLTEIGKRFDRSKDWVSRIVRWSTTGSPEIDWSRGSHATVTEIRKGAEKLFREAPMEQIESIIEKLPIERQRQIGSAAGHAHLKRMTEIDEGTRGGDFDRATDLGLRPSLYREKNALVAKLGEIKTWLDRHGDELVPDPDGGPAETQTALAHGALNADKGEIDLAFSEVGVGTSIEQGINDLLRGKE